MGLSYNLKEDSWEIGTPEFLWSFFSTVSKHCEPDGWGTRFPTLLGRLADDSELSPSEASDAMSELSIAHDVLATKVPAEVIWDLDNPEARPPWGDDISETITNLGNYFVTSDGQDLFEITKEALNALMAADEPLRIE